MYYIQYLSSQFPFPVLLQVVFGSQHSHQYADASIYGGGGESGGAFKQIETAL